MNAVTKIEPRAHLLPSMAAKYQLEPDQFAKTVRATCGMPKATAEQFAAFLIVAKTYDLNPVLREIWAFPSKDGGIVPIVSIDGWANLVNSHPQCDGFEFSWDGEGEELSCTCSIYRKDRKHPVTVTEWLIECRRNTDVWRTMTRRMLRHKAFIQSARLAFGLAGIYDEDEGRVIAEAPVKDVTPHRVPSPSEVEPPLPEDGIKSNPTEIEGPHGSDKYRPGDVVSTKNEDPITTGPQPAPKSKLKWPDLRKDYEKWMTTAFKRINEHADGGELATFLEIELQPFLDKLLPPDREDVIACYDRRQAAIKGGE